jgi:hypothetical protein
MDTHKYSQISARLCQSGGLLFILFRYVITNAPDWITSIASILILAGLCFALAGEIARRREQGAKRKTEAGV